MPKNRIIPRRTFLRGLGVGLALPYLDVMRTVSRAGQSAASPPLRFACGVQPNGVYPPGWDVTGAGREFTLSRILSPLQALKDDLVVLSNLDNFGATGHVELTAAFLTGVPIRNHRNGISLDQIIANQIGRDTDLPSIQLGTEPPRQGFVKDEPISTASTVSWSSSTTRLSPEINPRVAFDRMFRNRVSPEARRAATDHQSVVDLVMEDARSLSRQAGAQDRRKLDEYLESVRSVEVRIDRALNPPRRSWVPPTRPELVAPADGLPIRRDEHLRIMMDLLVLALWTDTTRVATLMAAHGFSRQNFSFLDGITSDHHAISHHKNQPKGVADYETVSRWYIEQFAYLLDKMKKVDEGEGSLLDHTVVMFGSEMKDGNLHVRENLPILLAGRGRGTLRTGRHVVLEPHTPLANLHLTLAQSFGCEIDSFNGTSTGTLGQLS
jgi:hypothetical protein